MPWYEYRCAAGHLTEQRQPRDKGEIDCDCGLTAWRLISSGVGVSGFVPTPTAQARIPFSHYIEAQGEVVESARRAGVEPPDLWGLAQRRIARGDVKAIE